MDEEQFDASEGEYVTPQSEPRFWSRPLVLVLVSVFLSSGITVIGMSVGWKASTDTFAAVTTVKMEQYDHRIHDLEEDDKDRLKASDLQMRDQLLDSKLSLLQSEIAGLKDQISNIPVHR